MEYFNEMNLKKINEVKWSGMQRE